ncbi:MAG: insulinase family protein, partial [Bacteriovoracaceae bacterium]|nr:insulinase family protein [Bacteriovoracaceae bacterium]
MQQKLLKLKNNLPVIFIQAPGSKVAYVQIWFRAGSSLETYPEFGIAHFLEH